MNPLEAMGMDLARLWGEQRRYNDAIKAVQTERPNWMETYLLGLVGEVNEVLGALRWKYHKPGRNRSIDRDALELELTDMLKYVVCLWQETGFSLADMLAAWGRKNRHLEHLLSLDWFPPEGRNIIVSDLDGTVADYRQGYASWAKLKDNVQTLATDLDNGLPWDEYERAKTEFERSGGYGSLRAYPDAVRLLGNEQLANTYLLVVTARPAEAISRVRRDTDEWLQRHGLLADALLFGRDERLVQLLKLAPNNKLLLLEDDPTLALRAAGAGFRVWLRDQPYNQAIEHPNLRRYSQFPERVDWEAA
jgi:NTP pyrophosphatase (non-canonical NTP hydrolase)